MSEFVKALYKSQCQRVVNQVRVKNNLVSGSVFCKNRFGRTSGILTNRYPCSSRLIGLLFFFIDCSMKKLMSPLGGSTVSEPFHTNFNRLSMSSTPVFQYLFVFVVDLKVLMAQRVEYQEGFRAVKLSDPIFILQVCSKFWQYACTL